MHIAILDLGTNTFQLLIAEKTKSKTTIIERREQWVLLAEKGIETISAEALLRAQNTLIDYSTFINTYQCKIIIAAGTAAFRKAGNAQRLKQLVNETIGAEVSIISGDEEAGYIYKGVCYAIESTKHIPVSTSPFLIIDIGGGSTEFIIGTTQTVIYKESFPLGATVLKQKHQRGPELTPLEIDAIKADVLRQTAHILSLCKEHQIKTLIGAAGSFDTYAYLLEPYVYQKNNSIIQLLKESLLQLIHQLYFMSESDRRDIMKEKSFRAPMISVAGAITQTLLDTLPLENIFQSGYSLKEGVLSELCRN